MKRIIILLAIIFCSSNGFSQGLSLERCREKAKENYPLIKQYDLIEQSAKYTIENINKVLLPQWTLNGQASYQTEVTHLPIEIPGMNVPILDKDQYRLNIDLAQTIWDGGMRKSKIRSTEASSLAEQKNNEVAIYSINQTVNQLFFGILNIQAQLEQLEIANKDLNLLLSTVDAFVQNGTAMPSDADAVKVEVLRTNQQKVMLLSLDIAYRQMLSAMIGEEVSKTTILQKPEISNMDVLKITLYRPELELFEAQRNLNMSQLNAIKAKNRPMLSLFAQVGYGRPGLNMLYNKFDFYGMGGIRFSWNFSNLYTQKNEKRLIEISKSKIDVNEETFRFNNNQQVLRAQQDIDKAKQLMESDIEILNLRKNIKIASESKYQNGVYTLNDLLKDVNAENQARQAQELHQIEYYQAIQQYKYLLGTQK